MFKMIHFISSSGKSQNSENGALKCLLAFITIFIGADSFSAGTKAQAASVDAPLASKWDGDLKTLQYKGHTFIVGVRGNAVADYPLIGSRKLNKPSYSAEAFPMTIQEQSTFVLYDKTGKKFIVYNIATCLKGKDTENSEKTDWVGELKKSADHWEADIIVFRKYDKKGPGMRAPYYSMGRSFPFFVQDDGSCIAQYNYFGNLKLELVSREVADEMLQRIIDDHDKHYHEREDNK